MRIVTGAEMAAVDAGAVKEYGIPSAALMERAGHEVAIRIRDSLGSGLGDARVHLLCGGGNNGGDGFVAARSLANWGAKVRVSLLAPPDKLKGDAVLFYRALVRMGIQATPVTQGDLRKLSLSLRTADMVVDAMLGTGIQGGLRPVYARVVRAVNDSGRPVVAVDVPTGVHADSGRVDGEAVSARTTVTFGLPKIGHLIFPGRRYTGDLHVVDIGLPRRLLTSAGGDRVWFRRQEALGLLRARPVEGHKGSFGRVVVVAGSTGMAGAAVLAAQGALKGGAGLVTWAGPATLLPIIQSLVPEATAVPLPETDGTLAADAAGRILEAVKQGDVLAFGPGLRTREGVARVGAELLEQSPVPVVVDADGLNALARYAPRTSERLAEDRVRVLTPHAKEASRLLGVDVDAVTGGRLECVERLAKMWRSTCLLKGSPTLVHATSGRLYVNGSGDVSLATGGTGDVLTGLIASLLAQGYAAGEAAALGAFVHGRAGELAGAKEGRHGTVASDVARFVGAALRELEQDEHDSYADRPRRTSDRDGRAGG